MNNLTWYFTNIGIGADVLSYLYKHTDLGKFNKIKYSVDVDEQYVHGRLVIEDYTDEEKKQGYDREKQILDALVSAVEGKK